MYQNTQRSTKSHNYPKQDDEQFKTKNTAKCCIQRLKW